MDNSHIAARKLDNSWGKLKPDDLIIDGNNYTSVYDWWKAVNENDRLLSANIQKVIEDYRLTNEKLHIVEPVLKKYVIRHLKPSELSGIYAGVPRRNNLPGDLILKEDDYNNITTQGLDLTKEAMLPFLLAARLTTIQQDKRPVFAEGLASSFEAFRFTREERLKKELGSVTDFDDDIIESNTTTDPRFLQQYVKNRGMSYFRDVEDWLGGLPYEYASVDEVRSYLAPKGFDLIRINHAASHGCNELVFQKLSAQGRR